MLIDRMLRGEFHHDVHPFKAVLYWCERRLGHLLFRRHPPVGAGPRLLNLGCGPIGYPGWVNADEYAFKRAWREANFRPDWRLDLTRPWACADSYWDGIFTQHALEHVHYADAVFALKECYRTLKPASWLRVSVPSIESYVRFYRGRASDPFFSRFPSGALAISFATQMHAHRSCWDAALLSTVLSELGFVDVASVPFGQGGDPRIIKDQEEKRAESLYVEARKPA